MNRGGGGGHVGTQNTSDGEDRSGPRLGQSNREQERILEIQRQKGLTTNNNNVDQSVSTRKNADSAGDSAVIGWRLVDAFLAKKSGSGSGRERERESEASKLVSWRSVLLLPAKPVLLLDTWRPSQPTIHTAWNNDWNVGRTKDDEERDGRMLPG